MAINHFIHPEHPLNPIDSDREYVCNGCKTLGTGKSYRCSSHGCDFNMHDYCGTCPDSLSSSMHKKHPLTLVLRAQADMHLDKVCDICSDHVKGLFYQCRECEFDVHPLCTQLPDELNHAMHKDHSLRLESPSTDGPCAVCRESCNGWRYRCGACGFDIHLQCVLVPAKPAGETSSRGINNHGYGHGIPYWPPLQFAPYHYYYYHHHYNGYGHHGFNYYSPNHYYNGYGQPGFIYYSPNYQMYPHQNHQHVGTSGSTAGRVGRSMFNLVSQLGIGVISNMVFGMDLTSLI